MKLLVLVGPTASGKTRLSLELAKRYDAEIVSGDSMQVYRGMDIGTAKATAEERRQVKHHLIDIRDPDEPFSVSEFQQEARAVIRDIHQRGKLPFLVGGTGLYVESVCYEYRFSNAGEDESFRHEMYLYAKQHGNEALHRKLAGIDPTSAERLHPNDVRRIVRALEIYHLTGVTLTDTLARQEKRSPYELCIIGLRMERAKLYARINERVDRMMEMGLVEEVDRLRRSGVPDDAVSMQGLGYKEILSYLRGDMTREEAVETLKRDTRRFAKRQLSWFRHMKEIHWIDVTGEQIDAPMKQINDIITGRLGIHATI